uniref:Uncharacterized protein n=1 Tax=Cacopsylla melanoneura TaxID=428564 RepID=A0A8D8W972_9HEMI
MNFADNMNSIEGGQPSYKKLQDLELDKEYKIKDFKIIETQYGSKLSVLIDDYRILLPNRYAKKYTQKELDKINNDKNAKHYITYSGQKSIGNSKTMHDISFRTKSRNTDL